MNGLRGWEREGNFEECLKLPGYVPIKYYFPYLICLSLLFLQGEIENFMTSLSNTRTYRHTPLS